jgi:alkanesulfonate monooxygenase SsuD/methylene tetrahydromethanopterin reductase-like flavin-dependent oxidoreductase (luciferase family)
VKIGLYIPSTTWDGEATRLGSKLAEIAVAAEAAGFDAIDVAVSGSIR